MSAAMKVKVGHTILIPQCVLGHIHDTSTIYSRNDLTVFVNCYIQTLTR